MYFIGIDSNSRRSKTLLLHLESGKTVAEASCSHALIEGLPEGAMEQDPLSWLHAIDETLRSCLAKVGNDAAKKVAAFGVSGQQQGLVVLDSQDRVIRPAKLAEDTSSRAQAEEINRIFGGAPGLIEMTGAPVTSASTAAKILWLKQHEPYHFQRVKRVLLPHDFINYWLTGTCRTEHGDASGTGLLDIRTRKWSPALLEEIDPSLRDILPEIGSSSKPCGTLRPELAKKWSLPDGITVSAGSGERMMKAIGANCITPGIASLDLGTGAALCAGSADPVIDPRSEVVALCDGTGHWLPLFQISNALSVTRSVRRHYGMDSEQAEATVTRSKPGAEGLMMLPYLKSEQALRISDPSASWHNIRAHNFTPANIIRASIEGVATGLAYGLQRMGELGLEPDEVRLSGKGADSPVWRQILADSLNLPVVASQASGGAALGAALQAAALWLDISKKSGHFFPFLAKLANHVIKPDPGTRCEPVPAHKGIYADLLSRQQYLIETLHGAGFL